MLQVISSEQALDLLAQELAPREGQPQILPLTEAVGRIAAEAICCQEQIPPFTRSMVDGYALRGEDSFGAGESLPARLLLGGRVEMGSKPDFCLLPGQAAYVPTGGCLPEGADAMIMLEYCEEPGDGYVYLYKAAAPGQQLIFAGDDAQAGQELIPKYQRLLPHHCGILAAAGISQVAVLPRLRVGIIAGGDELVDIDTQPQAGQIRDVNSYLLATALSTEGAEARLYGIAADNAQSLLNLSQQALAECDMLLLSGGSSVGQKDHTQWVLEHLPASRLLLHGLAIKPGKPTLLAISQGKAVFGLPGHPLSAYFVYRLLVRRALQLLEGQPRPWPCRVKARMAQNYPSNSGREEYLPLRLEQRERGLYGWPIFNKSGLISLLKQADGYTIIPRAWEGLAKDQEIEVELF